MKRYSLEFDAHASDSDPLNGVSLPLSQLLHISASLPAAILPLRFIYISMEMLISWYFQCHFIVLAISQYMTSYNNALRDCSVHSQSRPTEMTEKVVNSFTSSLALACHHICISNLIQRWKHSFPKFIITS